MTKKIVKPDPVSEREPGEPKVQGFGGFLRDPWPADDRLIALKLQILMLLRYPEKVKTKEINKLFNSLTEQQQEKLADIMAEFADAVHDESIVPMLIKVPKRALNSKHAMVRVPIHALTDEAANARRTSENERIRDYRSQMTEEDKVSERKKAAARMRELRQRRKNT